MKLGERIAKLLEGGETIELASDLGGGKTTLVKGLARGLGYKGEVVSPTFTIGRVYNLPNGRELHHFDFYRLAEGDVVADQLAEVAGREGAITVIEWAESASHSLPQDRLTITIESTGETTRGITIGGSDRYQNLIEALHDPDA